MRVAVTGATGRLGSALRDRAGRCAVHRSGRTTRLGPIGLRPGRARIGRGAARSRPAGGRRAYGGLDRCRRLRPRPGARAAAERHRDGRPGDGLCGSRASTWSSISTNEVFDGSSDRRHRATRRPIRRRRRTRTARPSWRGSGLRPRPSRPAPVEAAALGIVRTAWLFGPPGRTSRARSWRRPIAPRRPASRSRSSATSGGLPRSPPTSPMRSWTLLAEDAHDGIHHVVNGLIATRAHWAAIPRRASLVAGRRSSTSRARPGSAPSVPPRWGVLAATALPSGEPLRPWPDAMADYAPALERTWRRERVAP